jgi:hypothetical protein
MTYARQEWSGVTVPNPLEETFNVAGVSCSGRKACIAAAWGIGRPPRALEGYLIFGATSG